MKKVCVITTTRADYGLLRWTIEGLSKQSTIQTQVIVTGTHLSEKYGLTYRQIESDAIKIDRKVYYISNDRSSLGIVEETGVCCQKIGKALYELSPSLVVVLGDRYELLPICASALLLNIPIAHIAGGEITEGAIDNQVRNAITMMASLHFPNSVESKNIIIRMKDNDRNVFNVGEPGIENFYRMNLKSRDELSKELSLDITKKWVLVTLHPETKLPLENNLFMAKSMMEELLKCEGIEIILSESNADFGGREMNQYYHSIENENDQLHIVHSLGQLNYISFMKQAFFVIGNSSSGVIETPFLGIPTINIGDRQKGRRLAENVISANRDKSSIEQAIMTATKVEYFPPDYSFGNGKTSEYIVEYIKQYLYDN